MFEYGVLIHITLRARFVGQIDIIQILKERKHLSSDLGYKFDFLI